MRKSTVSKQEHKQLNKGRPHGTKTVTVNSVKLKKFCQLWSMATPRESVMKELGISKPTYYRYIDASEEIVDDFLLGFVDHGLVLQFRTIMERVGIRADKLDQLASKGLEDYNNLKQEEKLGIDRLVRNANATDKLYSEMLDDSKLVNQAVKTLNKVILKSAEKRK